MEFLEYLNDVLKSKNVQEAHNEAYSMQEINSYFFRSSFSMA